MFSPITPINDSELNPAELNPSEHEPPLSLLETQETTSQRICLWTKIFFMFLCCPSCWMNDE